MEEARKIRVILMELTTKEGEEDVTKAGSSVIIAISLVIMPLSVASQRKIRKKDKRLTWHR